MEDKEGQDVREVCQTNVKSRLELEYCFFQQNKDLTAFYLVCDM